jgi:hypothetical protein
MSIDRADHLALLLVTESDRPEEWPFIAQVVLNRVRTTGYPDTLEGVIYQRYQFSFYNPWTKAKLPHEDVYQKARQQKGARATRLSVARVCAEAMLAMPPACELLPRGTVNYWSPVSMLPKGSLPRGWNWNILRCFTVPGIEASRFVWAQTVEVTVPGTGRPFRFEGWPTPG